MYNFNVTGIAKNYNAAHAMKQVNSRNNSPSFQGTTKDSTNRSPFDYPPERVETPQLRPASNRSPFDYPPERVETPQSQPTSNLRFDQPTSNRSPFDYPPERVETPQSQLTSKDYFHLR